MSQHNHQNIQIMSSNRTEIQIDIEDIHITQFIGWFLIEIIYFFKRTINLFKFFTFFYTEHNNKDVRCHKF